MSKPPAFQFYPSDYLGSQRVSLMSLEEEGGYVRLLCYCWLHGSIPSDPILIARLIGKGASTTLATTLATMFKADPSNPAVMIHERLDAERAKQAVWRDKSRNGGIKSAQRREKLKGGSTVVEECLPNGSNQKATLQSSSSVSTNTPLPPSQGEKKKEKGPLQLRAESIFRRRPETPLTTAEQRAFTKNKSAILATTEADWLTLEKFYALPQSETYARKDLAALLNNWNGEIDRAKGYFSSQPKTRFEPTLRVE